MTRQNSLRQPSILRESYARLLNAFLVITARERASLGPSTTRIRTLLERFVEVRHRTDATEQAHAIDDYKCISTLLLGYNQTVARYRQQQEQVADDFNLLDVMRLTGKEIRHSMVLAWLLDHDLRKLGTHAQGNLGFRLFLSEFSELHLPADYADCNYWVRRQVAGDESIVDLEIGCRGRFLIHIENKIWSREGDAQTDRQWDDLLRRARDLKVSAPHVHALFLTPHGTSPANPHFHAIPWGRIVRVLERFHAEAKPLDVKLFSAHYARALRRFIVIQNLNEDDNAETTPERS